MAPHLIARSLFGRCLTLVVALAALSPGTLSSQQVRESNAPKSITARRVTGPSPAIDGNLQESVWTAMEFSTGFVQVEPVTGARATQQTAVSVAYDDEAIYVAMRMFDSEPHLIHAPLSRRDDASAPAEWAGVGFDSNHDRRTAYRFMTTPRGVQADVLLFEDSRQDPNWDAVWEVATRIDSLGWTAEFRIPLSQLRYSVAGGKAGPWGIQFGREVSRLSETTIWSPMVPGTNRIVSYYGELHGLDGLAVTRRLEVMPYTLAKLRRVPGETSNPFYRRNDAAASAGADIKYGLTPNLTLTATINPDFGQVEADPSVVNLGTFETFFPEKRPFFTEGADIFRFAMSPELQVFYTRRVGRPPQRFVRAPARGYADMPEISRILGAAKISGKTSKGWSIGLLHAVTAGSSARVADSLDERWSEPVEPLTHYSVARLVRDFRQGGSGVGVIGTSTLRQLDDPKLEFLRTRSFAGGANAWHRFAGRRYEARLLMLGTLLNGSEAAIAATQRSSVHRFQRPDASHIDYDTTITSMGGWAGEAAVQKIAGDWYGGVTLGIRSPGLEVNDAGFNTYSDMWYLAPHWNYRTFKPGKYLRSWSTGFTAVPGWSFGGEMVRSVLEYRFNTQLRNLWGASVFAARWQESLSPWDLRGGPALMNAAYSEVDVSANTNRRNAVSGSLRVYGSYAEETAERRVTVSPGLTVRPSVAATITVTPSASWNRDEDQYVGTFAANGKLNYVMGHLEQTTAALTLRMSYAFSPDLALDVYAQPFLSSGSYTTMREVSDPGSKSFNQRYSTLGNDRLALDSARKRYSVDVDRDGRNDFAFANPDFSVRQLRANTVLRWQYRPGSTIYLVWSQARDDGAVRSGFPVGRELDRLFSTNARNVFLLKASYWMGQ